MTTQAASRSEANNQNTQEIVVSMAEKFGVDEAQLLATLKATAFRQSGDNVITNEQMHALLIVANQYNLNPFTKEIYAFPDYKSGGIVPVVSVEGWNRIANENPMFNGVDFKYSKEAVKYEDANSPVHTWIEAILYRKDRKRPIHIREYVDECYKPVYVDQWGNAKPGPWQTHPKRMLRHKTLIQCYRVGFGFVGIYDEDEAYRIINADMDSNSRPQRAKVVELKPTNVNKALEQQPATTVETVIGESEAVQAQPEPVPANESTVQTQHTVNQQSHQETFNKEQVDIFLEKLIPRAVKNNQWLAALELINDRLSGAAAEYARTVLTKKREEVVAGQTEDESNISSSTEKEQPADSTDKSENETSS